MKINYTLVSRIKEYHSIADINEHVKKRKVQTLKVLNNCCKTTYPKNLIH